MKDIHFVHTSDWHLGFYQYNKRERFNDFTQAADKAISKIISLKPEFVLHTGDIFHHPKPSPETLRAAVRILKKLDDAEIPMYIVRGNHDGKVSRYLQRGGGIISLLKDLQLLTYIDDEVIEKDDYIIMGVGYYPGKRVAGRIEELVQENPNFVLSEKFRILGIHGFVEGQIEDISQIKLKQISKIGVDYFGAGHYHIPWYDEEKKVFAPGSLEATAITDSNRDDNIDGVSMYSSFFEIKVKRQEEGWEKIERKTHNIPIRPKIHLYYETEKENIADIQVEMENKIIETRKTIAKNEPSLSMQQPILNVKIQTTLEFSEMSKINVEEWFNDKFLHVISHVDGKSNVPEFKVDLTRSKEKEEVLVDLIRQNKLDPEIHTDIITKLLNAFGGYSTSRAISDDLKSGIKDLLLAKQKKINPSKDNKSEDETSKKKNVNNQIKHESMDDSAKTIGLDKFDL